MTKVKFGDTIKLHYTGRLEGGQVFDSTRERDPVQLTVGETMLTQLEVGQQVELRHENGRVTVIEVVSVSDSEAVLEAQRYLAEKEMLFELEVVDIL